MSTLKVELDSKLKPLLAGGLATAIPLLAFEAFGISLAGYRSGHFCTHKSCLG
jgi:hypothetical protein